MYKFYLKVVIYLLCFAISMFGLSAFDFNRFLKKSHVAAAWVLYFTVGMSMAYLVGSFLIALIYYFYQ